MTVHALRPGHHLDLGTVLAPGGGPAGRLRMPLSVLTGQLFIAGTAGEVSRVVALLLDQLDAAGVPWLRVGRLPAPRGGGPAAPVTEIDLADPGGIPVTLNPLWPEPGYPVGRHVTAVCALLQAAFALPDPVRDALGLALGRVFVAGTWFGQQAPVLPRLERAAVEVARESGHGEPMAAALRGLIRGRLGGLCGPLTGLLVDGGHPADTAGLFRLNVDVITGGAGGAAGQALLAGAVALRAAERACLDPPAAGHAAPRRVLVLEDPGPLAGGWPAARQIGCLLGDAAAHGMGVVVTGHAPLAAQSVAAAAALTIGHQAGTTVVSGAGQGRQVAVRLPPAEAGRRPGRAPGAESLIARRSAACGRSCLTDRACTRGEIRLATGIAGAAGDPASAWLRLWTRALLLAFLTARPLPAAPEPLRAEWGSRDPRLRECALATVADEAVGARAAALHGYYPPPALTRAVARTAAALLAGPAAPRLAGRVWVVPQLRWAHEAARVGWGAPACSGGAAPPLDFALAGLPDWPGIPAAERLRLLLRHPMSLATARNRELAATALYGEHGRSAFEASLATDLAAVLPGLADPADAGGLAALAARPGGGPAGASGRPTRLPDCPGDWLVMVLRWPVTG